MSSRRDLGNIHSHGVEINPVKHRVKCNYCGREMSGGFHRLKCHLGELDGNVVPCKKVPEHVKAVLRKELREKKLKKVEKEEKNNPNSHSRKRKANILEGDGFLNQEPFQEVNTNSVDDSLATEAIVSTQKYVDSMRKSWEMTGCTILLDGWVNSKNQTLVNILVYSPKGTVYLKSHDISTFIGNDGAMQLFLDEVIQEVGVENLVQIITYTTTSFMKSTGDQVMKKYKNVFWSVSASHCIEKMLDGIKEIPIVREALEKVTIVKEFICLHKADDDRVETLMKSPKFMSIESFFTLENIDANKCMLKKMIVSPDWKASDLSNSPDGVKVADLVGQELFWDNAKRALKTCSPLIRALQEIHENNEPLTGRIYKLIDEIKENIKEVLKNKKILYKVFVVEIDEIWANHLYNATHSVGRYLNPFIPYRSSPLSEYAIVDMGRDQNARNLITEQVEKYRQKRSMEESSITGMNHPQGSSPVEWWLNHGGEYPELRTVAIRILSQTCDGAEKFKLRREAVDNMFSGEKKHDDRQKLQKYAFVHYNLQLQEFCSGEGRLIVDGTEHN